MSKEIFITGFFYLGFGAFAAMCSSKIADVILWPLVVIMCLLDRAWEIVIGETPNDRT